MSKFAALQGWVQNPPMSKQEYISMLNFFKQPNYRGYKSLKDNYNLIQSFKYDKAQVREDVETYLVIEEIIKVLQAKYDAIQKIVESKKRT